MQDNLYIKEDAGEVTEESAEFETTSRAEYISAAYYAIAAVSELDVELMPPQDRMRKRNIIRKSLRIIDNIINELDEELFDEDSENDEDY